MSRSIGLLLRALPRLSLLLLLCTGLASGLTGCESNRDVAVRVSIPDPDSAETPAAGVGVVALPYDRDSVLASLEARARTPRPHTAALDSMFARFRGPFTSYTALAYREGVLRDSLGRLQSRFDSVPRGSPGYPALSAQQRRLADSLTRIGRQAARARTALDRARADFVARSESLRTAVRQWEDSTYRGWESISESLARASRRQPVTDTTDATGWAHFTLAPGAWWIYARAWDTSDPNSQWYWNLPADADTVLLSSRNGRRQPRY
ncbi:MAG TPA: hypothetical protein VFO71_07380 [Gemmatimonadales bacterium]|nr:hypothetical protein [Gemmatimonadales bacterium]